MSVPLEQCNHLETFSAVQTLAKDAAMVSSQPMGLKLPRELLMEVGGQGIIGRRVVMSNGSVDTHGEFAQAEGIVGFNTA